MPVYTTRGSEKTRPTNQNMLNKCVFFPHVVHVQCEET